MIAEHRIMESYSGDGLIVAVFGDARCDPVPIPYARASQSIFRETEYDLADLSKKPWWKSTPLSRVAGR